MKLAIVVQRYGTDVAGGSEAHCRAIAERLASEHEVTVLTSCAKDYVTWKNEYPAGESREAGMRVIRFRGRRRRMRRFVDISDRVYGGDGTAAEEEAWFRENGPRVPELLGYLKRHGSGFDRVLFWTYRYYPSYFGLPLVADRAVLIPTAEDDPAITLRSLGEYFSLPRGLLFLTPEEADLVGSRCIGPLPPHRIIGTGLEPAAVASASHAIPGVDVDEPFLLYVGRIDPNKGCRRLFRYFLRYLEGGGQPIRLVLAGRAVMSLPDHPLVHPVGFISDAQRDLLLSKARLVLAPSPYESLCISLLEAWNHARPALVNGSSAVLKGQVLRADGGLYYRNYEEFASALDLLLADPEICDRLGAQGLDYVERHYRWPIVMDSVARILE